MASKNSTVDSSKPIANEDLSQPNNPTKAITPESEDARKTTDASSISKGDDDRSEPNVALRPFWMKDKKVNGLDNLTKSTGNVAPSKSRTDGGTLPRNIIVFGETGVGKSSLIKMLMGDSSENQPKVSSDAAGCTADAAGYSITIPKGDVKYRMWDTPGLDEGGGGTVDKSFAIQKIHDLVQELVEDGAGVNLLIYCIRGLEYRDILRVNYDLVAKHVCRGKIPVVAVVSWLENEENMTDWWKRHKAHFKDMKFAGQVSVTTTKGRIDGNGRGVFEKEYGESKGRVQDIIRKKSLSKAIKPDQIDVGVVLQEYMDAHNSRTKEERKSIVRMLGIKSIKS